MPDTFTTHARLRKIASGGDADTWGAECNGTLDLIEEMLYGVQTLNIAGDYTLAAIGDDLTSETRRRAYRLTGAPVAPFAVIVPTGLVRNFLLYNSRAFDCTVKYSGSPGFLVKSGTAVNLCADGTDVRECSGTDPNNAFNVSWLTWLPPAVFAKQNQQAKFTKAVTYSGWTPLTVSAGALTLPFGSGNRFTVLLDQNITSLSVTGLVAGRASPFAIRFTQDGVGGRTIGSFYQKPAALSITPSPAAGAIDLMGGLAVSGPTLYVLEYLKALP